MQEKFVAIKQEKLRHFVDQSVLLRNTTDNEKKRILRDQTRVTADTKIGGTTVRDLIKRREQVGGNDIMDSLEDAWSDDVLDVAEKRAKENGTTAFSELAMEAGTLLAGALLPIILNKIRDTFDKKEEVIPATPANAFSNNEKIQEALTVLTGESPDPNQVVDLLNKVKLLLPEKFSNMATTNIELSNVVALVNVLRKTTVNKVNQSGSVEKEEQILLTDPIKLSNYLKNNNEIQETIMRMQIGSQDGDSPEKFKTYYDETMGKLAKLCTLSFGPVLSNQHSYKLFE